MSLQDQQLESYARGRRKAERAASYSTKYDRILHKRISSVLERRAIRRALALAGVEKASMLDVPCGAGRLSPVLRPVASPLVSCDYSPAMLQIFRDREESPCFVGSVFELPFRDSAFDVVFSARLSHHIGSPERRSDYLRALMRISRKAVIVTIFDRSSLKYRIRELSRRFNGKRSKHAFGRSEVESIAGSAGFRVRGRIPLSRLASGHVFYVLSRA